MNRLESALLTGNDRLQSCSRLDSAHVLPDEPASEHVRLIQEALRQVDGADIPASERNYGEKTTKAVVAFKTKKGLVTRGTKTIDPIVGTGTIGELDRLMKALEDKKKANVKPAKVVPRLALSGQCQVIGDVKDNPQADDMKFGDPLAARKSAGTVVITAPFILLSDSTLEATMLSSMATAVTIAGGTSTTFSIRGEALQMCSHFFTAAGAQREFAKGGAVSNEALTDVGFLEFVSRVRFVIDRAVRAAWKTGLVDDAAIAASLRTTLDAPTFGTGKLAGALAAFIGGFQGYRVELCGLTANTVTEKFSYSLDVQILDHFGVSDEDINRKEGALGAGIGTAMAAFFVLQHDRNEGGANRRLNKYRPFRVTLRADAGPFEAAVF